MGMIPPHIRKRLSPGISIHDVALDMAQLIDATVAHLECSPSSPIEQLVPGGHLTVPELGAIECAVSSVIFYAITGQSLSQKARVAFFQLMAQPSSMWSSMYQYCFPSRAHAPLNVIIDAITSTSTCSPVVADIVKKHAPTHPNDLFQTLAVLFVFVFGASACQMLTAVQKETWDPFSPSLLLDQFLAGDSVFATQYITEACRVHNGFPSIQLPAELAELAPEVDLHQSITLDFNAYNREEPLPGVYNASYLYPFHSACTFDPLRQDADRTLFYGFGQGNKPLCMNLVRMVAVRLSPITPALPEVVYTNTNKHSTVIHNDDDLIDNTQVVYKDYQHHLQNVHARELCERLKGQGEIFSTFYHWYLLFKVVSENVFFAHITDSVAPIWDGELDSLVSKTTDLTLAIDDEDKPLTLKDVTGASGTICCVNIVGEWIIGYADKRDPFRTPLQGMIYRMMYFPTSVLPTPHFSSIGFKNKSLLVPHPRYAAQTLSADEIFQSDATVAHMAFYSGMCVSTRIMSSGDLIVLLESIPLVTSNSTTPVYSPVDPSPRPNSTAGRSPTDMGLPSDFFDHCEGGFYYINDLTMPAAFDPRPGFYHYGALAIFDCQRRPCAIYVSHLNRFILNPVWSNNASTTVPVVDSPHMWNYAKFVWKTTFLFVQIVKHHLGIIHMLESESFASSTRSNLPSTNTFRTVVKPFTYGVIGVNIIADFALYNNTGFIVKIWAYDYAGLKSFLREVIKSHVIRPFPLTIDPTMQHESTFVQSYQYCTHPSLSYNSSLSIDDTHQLDAFYLSNVNAMNALTQDVERELDVLRKEDGTCFGLAAPTITQSIASVPQAITEQYGISKPVSDVSVTMLDTRAYRDCWCIDADTPSFSKSQVPIVVRAKKYRLPCAGNTTPSHHSDLALINPHWDRVFPIAYDSSRFWSIAFAYVESMYDLLCLSAGITNLFEHPEYNKWFTTWESTSLSGTRDDGQAYSNIVPLDTYTVELSELTPNSAAKLKFCVLVTQMIVNGTVSHEHFGHTIDHFLSPSAVGVKLSPEHMLQKVPAQSSQEYHQLMLLLALGNEKMPELLSNPHHLYFNTSLNDRNIYAHYANWLLFKYDLQVLAAEIDFRNKHCRDFPSVSCNPRVHGSSVSK